VKIIIAEIPHSEQRYPTVGDWFRTFNALQIRVSIMPDPRMALCVAVHELVEAVLCEHRGVPEKAVDEFDIAFEQRRAHGEVAEEAEPGDDEAAPYHKEHRFATLIEKLLAAELGLDWGEYEAAVLKIGEGGQ